MANIDVLIAVPSDNPTPASAPPIVAETTVVLAYVAVPGGTGTGGGGPLALIPDSFAVPRVYDTQVAPARDRTAALFGAGLGDQAPPQWTVNRTLMPCAEGFAQALAEPGIDTGLLAISDSTFEVNRGFWRHVDVLATRNPGLRFIYDKTNLGGGGDVYPNPTATPSPTFAAYRDGDTSGAFSRQWNAQTWADNGGTDQYAQLPGVPNYYLQVPAGARYAPWGAASTASRLTRGFVAIDVQPTTWMPAANMNLLTHDDAGTTAGRGTVLRVKTDGTLDLRLSPAGGAAGADKSASSTVTVLSKLTADGQRCAVGMEFDTDASGATTFTPYYRLGGHFGTWQALGAPVTVAGTGAWYGSPNVPWEVGSGAVFVGKWFETIVRIRDRQGPDLVPRLPQQWVPTNANFKGSLVGGRTVRVVNAAWGQHSTRDVVDRTDIGKPGTAVLTRAWNSDTPSALNVYSYADLLPLLPYALTLMNHDHNDEWTGLGQQQLIRQAALQIERRSPGAQHALVVQNPTLRNDPPSARYPAGTGPLLFDQSKVYGNKRAHDQRIADSAAIAHELGWSVLDGRSAMVDYVRNGGNLNDLVQTGGEQLHPNAVGADVQAQLFANMISRSNYGTTGVLA